MKHRFSRSSRADRQVEEGVRHKLPPPRSKHPLDSATGSPRRAWFSCPGASAPRIRLVVELGHARHARTVACIGNVRAVRRTPTRSRAGTRNLIPHCFSRFSGADRQVEESLRHGLPPPSSTHPLDSATGSPRCAWFSCPGASASRIRGVGLVGSRSRRSHCRLHRQGAHGESDSDSELSLNAKLDSAPFLALPQSEPAS